MAIRSTSKVVKFTSQSDATRSSKPLLSNTTSQPRNSRSQPASTQEAESSSTSSASQTAPSSPAKSSATSARNPTKDEPSSQTLNRPSAITPHPSPFQGKLSSSNSIPVRIDESILELKSNRLAIVANQKNTSRQHRMIPGPVIQRVDLLHHLLLF